MNLRRRELREGRPVKKLDTSSTSFARMTGNTGLQLLSCTLPRRRRDCCCSHVYAYLLPDTEHHLRELCHDILFGELRDFLRPNGIDQKCRVLVLFIVVLAVVSLNVFKGADDFNGNGHFYARFFFFWTGFGFSGQYCRGVCVAERFVTHHRGMKRTWDRKLSSGSMSGQLNLAITGWMLLTFMTIYLIKFRF